MGAPRASRRAPPTSLVEREERQEAQRLGDLRVRLDDGRGEPDREAAEVRTDRRFVETGPVAFVEEEVHDAEHRRQASETCLGRRARHVAFLAEAPACACEALLHGPWRDDEGTRHLFDREPEDRRESQRRALPGLERRVTAREQEVQQRVVEAARLGCAREALPRIEAREHLHRVPVRVDAPHAPEPVAVRVLRDRHEPGLGGVRRARDAPGRKRALDRVVHRVLGIGDRASECEQLGEDPRVDAPDRLGVRGARHGRHRQSTGLTSITWCRSAQIVLARASACASSLQSTR